MAAVTAMVTGLLMAVLELVEGAVEAVVEEAEDVVEAEEDSEDELDADELWEVLDDGVVLPDEMF